MNFFKRIKDDWEDFWYKYSEERHTIAHNRLMAHERAMKEGRNSPYTHPEEYPDGFF